VFLANPTESVRACTESVTAIVDCEKAANGFSKSQRPAEQYRISFHDMAVRSVTLEMSVNVFANNS
jgi:hypothetical protein